MSPYEDVLLAAARRVYPTSELSVTDSTCLHLTHQDGAKAYYWCSIPEERSRGLPFDERVRITVEYLQAFLIEEEDDETAPWDRIMPMVRPVGIVGSAGIVDGMVGDFIIARPLVDHLLEIVGLDHPAVTTAVTRKQAEGWRVSAERLYATARNNLRLSPLQTTILPIGATGQGASFIIGPYGYEPSWLLFPRAFAQPIGEVANPLRGQSRRLVFPVARNEMFVLPEDDEEAVAAAVRYVGERYFDDRRVMAPFAFVYEGGALVPWRRPGNPLARASWLQRRRFVRDQYIAAARLAQGTDNSAAETEPPLLPISGYGVLPTSVVVEEEDVAYIDEGRTPDGGSSGPLLPQVEYLDLRSELGRLVLPWELAAPVLGLRRVEDRLVSTWTLGIRPFRPEIWRRLRMLEVDPAVLAEK